MLQPQNAGMIRKTNDRSLFEPRQYSETASSGQSMSAKPLPTDSASGVPPGKSSQPLDPQVAQLLDLIARAKRPPIHALDVADAKIAYEKSAPILDISPPPVHDVENFAIPARDGHQIPVRLYAPREASWADPLPLLVYFHGGGFPVGSVNSHDALCRTFCMGAECLVLSVDYRLGPDWQFPTVRQRCLRRAALGLRRSRAAGRRPGRIALGGDSAGGTLAAASAVAARNAGLAPVLQLLIYPGTSARQDTPSHRALAERLPADRRHDPVVLFALPGPGRRPRRLAFRAAGRRAVPAPMCAGCARPGSPWPATTPCMTRAWPTQPSSRRRVCRPRWSTIRR